MEGLLFTLISGSVSRFRPILSSDPAAQSRSGASRPSLADSRLLRNLLQVSPPNEHHVVVL